MDTAQKWTQVLQQEAYPATWCPVDVQNSAIPGAIPQSGRKPVWDVAEPTCKISRQSANLQLRNPLPYKNRFKKQQMHSKLSIPPILRYVTITTYVVSGLRQTVFQRSILSIPMNVAIPIPFCLRYSTHCCAVLIVSTTMWSSDGHAVDTATSYFSSIAPRSPYHVTHN